MESRFDEIVDRKHIDSLKWDVAENELPMWVADMDFKTAPCIIEAIAKRVENGTFGYSIIPEEWYEAYIGWWKRRHNFEMHKEWLIFTTGVIPAVTCTVKRMTNPGDNVVVMTPVYDIFFHSIENHGRHVLENRLVYDGNMYNIDFFDLEEKLSNSITTMLILCNPQNPGGRIWSREELAKVGELCKKHSVVVVSDEVHCDLTDPGHEYIPFASVSEDCKNNSITCIAPSKAFNMAGLQSACVSIPNERIRNIMERGLNSNEIAEPNCFAITATIAAFTKGDNWIEELRKYLYNNKQTVTEFIKKELPDIKVMPSDATYLMWLDCSRICEDTEILAKSIRSKTGLYITAGGQYRGDGNKFIRVNVACPNSTVIDGLGRLKAGLGK